MSNLAEIRKIANTLIAEYQLPQWTFKYDKSERRYGLCNGRSRVISLNPIMVSRNTTERNIEVIKHEIAHAIVGCVNGHNDIWKAQMVRMGLRPGVYYSCTDTEIAPRRYTTTCICGQALSLNRKRKNVTYRCPKCKAAVIMNANETHKIEKAAAHISDKYGIDPSKFKQAINEIDF